MTYAKCYTINKNNRIVGIVAGYSEEDALDAFAREYDHTHGCEDLVVDSLTEDEFNRLRLGIFTAYEDFEELLEFEQNRNNKGKP